MDRQRARFNDQESEETKINKKLKWRTEMDRNIKEKKRTWTLMGEAITESTWTGRWSSGRTN